MKIMTTNSKNGWMADVWTLGPAKDTESMPGTDDIMRSELVEVSPETNEYIEDEPAFFTNIRDAINLFR